MRGREPVRVLSTGGEGATTQTLLLPAHMRVQGVVEHNHLSTDSRTQRTWGPPRPSRSGLCIHPRVAAGTRCGQSILTFGTSVSELHVSKPQARSQARRVTEANKEANERICSNYQIASYVHCARVAARFRTDQNRHLNPHSAGTATRAQQAWMGDSPAGLAFPIFATSNINRSRGEYPDTVNAFPRA